MANKKRDSLSGNIAASKIKKTSKKKTEKIVQDSPVAIFVRISQDAKNILDRASKSASITNVKVIERLLEHFEEQNPQTQEDILRGTYTDPIKEFENWQAQLLLAQHAIENDRYLLAEQLYETLAGDTHRSEKFISFCKYKLGLCWMGISNESRNEALLKKKESDNYRRFNFALTALDQAIRYTEEVKEELGPLFNLIMHYNRACCHSMKAQYMVEARIDFTEDEIPEICKAADDFTVAKEVWSNIGRNWRGEDKRVEIDDEARQALDELKKIFPLSSSEKSSSLTKNSNDIIWLVEAALKDQDLIFLHTDEKYQPEFKEWAESALRGHRSFIDAAQALLNKK